MVKFVRSSRLSLVLLAVAVLLIFLHYLGILVPVENLLIRILSPIQSSVYSAGAKINSFYTGFSASKDLKTENKKLQKDNDRLAVENSQLKTQLGDFQQLKIQNDFLVQANISAITAKVIGKNPEPNYQAIILDKGSNDGVAVDLPLITGNGLVIGKIFRVKSNSSEAILVNDSRSRIAAMVQNEKNSKGAVVGEHGLSLKIEMIPQNEAVKVGDIVVTSGLEPTIPRGLIIGKISRLVNEPNSFFQTAWLQSMIKLDDLTVVSILKNQNYD
ncbi:MAG: rod shape-determining protein MreC [Patescibacteria group bacterium]|jgi:rod shape-determining protein MreC